MLFWLLLACAGDEPASAPASTPAPDGLGSGLTIAYSHNVSGEIEPCG